MKKLKTNMFSLVLLSSGILFYLFFTFLDGPQICVDTPTYIYMESSREPLYPLLLAFLRGVTGELQTGENYLWITVILQGILSAIAAWSMAVFLWRNLGLSKTVTTMIFSLPLAVSLLCRFVAQRRSMYSNSILTEGIAISMYLLFFRFLLEYCLRRSKKSLMISALLCFFMISTRKQMIFSFVLLLLAILYNSIKQKNLIYGIKTFAFCAVVIFGSNLLLDVGYNYLVRGEASTHTSDIRFVSTLAFYTANREDGEKIDDSQIRELFYQIYDACDEKGYLKHSAGEGWSAREAHFSDYYDCIQIDTMWPAVNRFVTENYDCKDTQISEYADEVMKTISKAVIPGNMISVIQVFMDNFRAGLVGTVAQRNPLLDWYAVLIYLLYMGLLFLCMKKKCRQEILVFAGMTIASIMLNVGLVSLVIFCQIRYTIYNMALFYISMLLMTDALFFRKENSNETIFRNS